MFAQKHNKMSIILVSLGALGIASSVIYQSSVQAFIGLTFVFWGCLFLFIRDDKYVKSEVVEWVSSSSLFALDQMIFDSNVQGKGIYIPVPRGSYMPHHIGPSNEFVYISGENLETAKALEQAFAKNAAGLRIIPPGIGLANMIEKKTGLDFHDLNLASLVEVLPKIMTQELEMAEEFDMQFEESEVHIVIKKPISEELCKEVYEMQHLCPYVGSPLDSSVACILTRVANKPVRIERCSIRNSTIEATYRIF